MVRGGRETYRLLPTGEVANQQRMRVTNQMRETQRFTIEVLSPQGASLVVSESPIVVGPEQVVTVNVVTTVPQSVFVDGQAPVRYIVRSDGGFQKEVEFLLLGPYALHGGTAVKLLRTLSEYRWPIYLGGLLAMSIVACGVLVWVATRPDSPRPIRGYYEAARSWDADEAVEDASRQLGWTVRYDAAVRRPALSRACRGRWTCASPIATASRCRASRAGCSPSARRTLASTGQAI